MYVDVCKIPASIEMVKFLSLVFQYDKWHEFILNVEPKLHFCDKTLFVMLYWADQRASCFFHKVKDTFFCFHQ